ncbi:hypothetical protein ACFQI7_17025 [Paenibacillus allorhizosphaerae]|uniref:Cyclic lactone autoinducer peptide n=1 Tax=Paenibacillus allorhizosphaerae TaxID=2849866 RepID=A0ABM8VEY8_9BACL|nr:hypothetical protein [Paenibacillus allorhizosphaerae]CAG7630869.1 hypothetical protein PAECIP111802_01684 [Paenibacillus allorhizosphaerae]
MKKVSMLAAKYASSFLGVCALVFAVVQKFPMGEKEVPSELK